MRLPSRRETSTPARRISRRCWDVLATGRLTRSASASTLRSPCARSSTISRRCPWPSTLAISARPANKARFGFSLDIGGSTINHSIELLNEYGGACQGVRHLGGTCMNARGLTDADPIDRAHRSIMDELATATLLADQVLVF